MIRGGNARYKFNLPCLASELQTIKITFWQDGNRGPSTDRPLPIVKVKEQCELPEGEKYLFVTLNQEETLRFSEKRKARVQLRAVDYGGFPVVGQEHLLPVYPVYDDSILDGDILPSPDYDGWIYLDGSTIK